MPKLVNLGSLGVDHVYSVDHIVSSGETLASQAHEIFPGGKGSNQSIAAAKAGAEVIHVGCVGDDGDLVVNALKSANVDTSKVRVGDTSTQHAIIQVDNQGQNAIVIFGGANLTISDQDRNATFDSLKAGDWLLLQNEINDLEIVLAEASKRDVSVAFNIAPVDGREKNYDLSRVALLIVNEAEAESVSGEHEPSVAFDVLVERYPKMIVLLTLGKDGGIYGGNGHPKKTYESFVVNAVDETAAGDTFIGYFMAEWLKSQNLETALKDGSAAAAIAVTRKGAASSIPVREEVDAFLSH